MTGKANADQRMHGAPLDSDDFAAVTVPVQVVSGAKSPEVLRKGSQALAAVLPDAEHQELAGVSHNVKMDVLVPVIADFVAGERESAAASTRQRLARRRRPNGVDQPHRFHRAPDQGRREGEGVLRGHPRARVGKQWGNMPAYEFETGNPRSP